MSSAIQHTPNNERTAQIVHEVRDARSGIWDAPDQGRWARSVGVARNQNPHCSWHVNFGDWNRAWDAENARQEYAFTPKRIPSVLGGDN